MGNSRVRTAAVAIACLAVSFGTCAYPDTLSAITSDPSPNSKYPPRMEVLSIPSAGESMNAVFYLAAGDMPHPTALLLHGLPGNEQNLDLAQAMRREGWNVLTFHYRGSWGSHGTFSLSHAIEDAAVAIRLLRDPTSIEKYAIDPRRLVVIGHSMGGFVAARTVANDPAIKGLILISAANMGPYLANLRSPNVSKENLETFAADLPPLGGVTVQDILQDSVGHDADWDFPTYAPALKSRPILVITADDGLTRPSERLAQALRAEGPTDVRLIHMPTDHSYSGHRIALETAVIDWLDAHFR